MGACVSSKNKAAAPAQDNNTTKVAHAKATAAAAAAPANANTANDAGGDGKQQQPQTLTTAAQQEDHNKGAPQANTTYTHKPSQDQNLAAAAAEKQPQSPTQSSPSKRKIKLNQVTPAQSTTTNNNKREDAASASNSPATEADAPSAAAARSTPPPTLTYDPQAALAPFQPSPLYITQMKQFLADANIFMEANLSLSDDDIHKLVQESGAGESTQSYVQFLVEHKRKFKNVDTLTAALKIAHKESLSHRAEVFAYLQSPACKLFPPEDVWIDSELIDSLFQKTSTGSDTLSYLKQFSQAGVVYSSFDSLIMAMTRAPEHTKKRKAVIDLLVGTQTCKLKRRDSKAFGVDHVYTVQESALARKLFADPDEEVTREDVDRLLLLGGLDGDIIAEELKAFVAAGQTFDSIDDLIDAVEESVREHEQKSTTRVFNIQVKGKGTMLPDESLPKELQRFVIVPKGQRKPRKTSVYAVAIHRSKNQDMGSPSGGQRNSTHEASPSVQSPASGAVRSKRLSRRRSSWSEFNTFKSNLKKGGLKLARIDANASASSSSSSDDDNDDVQRNEEIREAIMQKITVDAPEEDPQPTKASRRRPPKMDTSEAMLASAGKAIESPMSVASNLNLPAESVIHRRGMSIFSPAQKVEAAKLLDEWVEFEIVCKNVANPASALYSPSYFVEIYRHRSSIWEKVMWSGCVTGSSNLVFEPMTARVHTLCHSKLDHQIRVVVQAKNDKVNFGRPAVVGEFETDLRSIFDHASQASPVTNAGGGKGFGLINPKKKKECGRLFFATARTCLNTSTAVINSTKPVLFERETDSFVRFVTHGYKLPPIDDKTPRVYLEFFRLEKRAWVLAHVTEVQDTNTPSPQFDVFSIRLSELCDGYYDKPVLIKVWHQYKGLSRPDELLGSVATSTREILRRINRRFALEREALNPTTAWISFESELAQHGATAAERRQAAKSVKSAQKALDAEEAVVIQFGAKKLKRMYTFSKNAPFLQIYRLRHGHWEMIGHTSHTVSNSKSPEWPPVTLSVRVLKGEGSSSSQGGSDVAASSTGGKNYAPLIIRCYNYNKNKSPDFIGEVRDLTYSSLRSKAGGGKGAFSFVNAESGVDKVVGELKIIGAKKLKGKEARKALDVQQAFRLKTAGGLRFIKATHLTAAEDLDRESDIAHLDTANLFDRGGFRGAAKRTAYIDHLNYGIKMLDSAANADHRSGERETRDNFTFENALMGDKKKKKRKKKKRRRSK